MDVDQCQDAAVVRQALPQFIAEFVSGDTSVGVWILGGNFVHQLARSRFGKKSPRAIPGATMRQPLTEEQEREVKQLAQAIAEAASQEFEQLARTLVRSGDVPFGQAEFRLPR